MCLLCYRYGAMAACTSLDGFIASPLSMCLTVDSCVIQAVCKWVDMHICVAPWISLLVKARVHSW